MVSCCEVLFFRRHNCLAKYIPNIIYEEQSIPVLFKCFYPNFDNFNNVIMCMIAVYNAQLEVEPLN